MSTAQQAARDRAISLRISRQERDLIDRASRALGKSRTDFMLDAARRRAEDVLLDQALFQLEPEAYERFVTLLDSAPEPSLELRRLLRHPAPWE